MCGCARAAQCYSVHQQEESCRVQVVGSETILTNIASRGVRTCGEIPRFFFPWPYQPHQCYCENTERVALRRRLPEDDQFVVPHNLYPGRIRV